MTDELHIVGFQVGRETYGVPITSRTKSCESLKSRLCGRSCLFGRMINLRARSFLHGPAQAFRRKAGCAEQAERILVWNIPENSPD